jgi:hypothetical protein
MTGNKFSIAPHMRLHEWIARDKGYFLDEGLDFELSGPLASKQGKVHDFGDKVGAYQIFEQGRTCNVSSSCHWTVNTAASAGYGRMFRDAYSVAYAGIYVHPDTRIEKPEQLANIPVSVGYQSGSHYSSIQVLEQWLKPEEINLSFSDGLLFRRMELLIDHKVPAANLFSGPAYLVEQLGFRKICECTFMIAAMINGDPDPGDVAKYFRALRRAQRDIDLRPELYTHYYLEELPQRFHTMVDVRRMGPGERIVFEPYTRETFEACRRWISDHNIFPEGSPAQRDYESVTISIQ